MNLQNIIKEDSSVPGDSKPMSVDDFVISGQATHLNDFRDFIANEFGFRKPFAKELVKKLFSKIEEEISVKGNSVRLGPVVGTLKPVIVPALEAKRLPTGEVIPVGRRVKVSLDNEPFLREHL